MKTMRIGLAGFGTVGSAVYRQIRANAGLLRERCGILPLICAIAVRKRRQTRRHGARLPATLLVADVRELADRPDLDLVIEVMGGCGDARRLLLAALRARKPVVTANKALLAEHGRELFGEMHRRQTPIFFEASVAGGIPLIQALRDSLVANRCHLIYGIVNGTCNYILSRMSEEGVAFDVALAQAQRLGYAEPDPSLDIDGVDAAHKATILASVANGGCVEFANVHVEGIREVTSEDVRFAHQLGYEIKLLAIIRSPGASRVEVRVHPTLIPKANQLASVRGVTNSIMVRGHVVGDIGFSGPGAGGNATASAVLGDVAQAARYLANRMARPRRDGAAPPLPCIEAHGPRVISIDRVVSRYYLRLSVTDRPGVMAQVSSVLGRSAIGISSIIQPEGHEGRVVPLIFMIHDAPWDAMRRALRRIHHLPCVKARPVMFRVETFES